jgi:hypothetical protein
MLRSRPSTIYVRLSLRPQCSIRSSERARFRRNSGGHRASGDPSRAQHLVKRQPLPTMPIEGEAGIASSSDAPRATVLALILSPVLAIHCRKSCAAARHSDTSQQKP